MSEGDKISTGSFPVSQLTGEISSATQDNHLSVTHPPAAEDNIQEGRTLAPSKKPPRPSRKVPASRQDPATMNPKDFKELMIRLRLDTWKAKAQVVPIQNQVDVTSFWSPQWAGIIESGRWMNVFDGFDRFWVVPFDSETPLPAEKQTIADDLRKRHNEVRDVYRSKTTQDRGFHDKMLRLIEDEVKETCQNLWDANFYKPHMASTPWSEVRQAYDLPSLVSMIARTRLEDETEQLPGYHRVLVLELGIDGKVTYQRISVPIGSNINGLVSRLDSWFPHDDEHSSHVIERFHQKLDFLSKRGDEAQKRKLQLMHRQLDRFVKPSEPDCELSQWIFRLWIKSDYSIPFGKSPDQVRTWTRLKEDKYQELLTGVYAKKYPVFVRPWKIRLRRWWAELEELEKQVEERYGEMGLSIEQLEMVDLLLVCRTDEEREQAAKSKQALDMAKMAML
ncbi:unnamed protein product [Fusarium equiseti]|uniref:Uncharacterized protein n=1 Tax=Fusarium equiseti TaxID=61235 RepID=A0A8J2IVH0_FUSEQ|nr:unnamed protein product [Fusarium equiseti]